MPKVLQIFVVLSLILMIQAEDCEGNDCQTMLEGQGIQISEAALLVDREARRLYWYYLRGADMLYESNFNTKDRFLFFFIYRNIVGTFLCISSWDKLTEQIRINNIIRLGSGYSKNHQIGQPVKIEPFMLELKLDEGQYKIEFNERGAFEVNGQISNIIVEEEPNQQEILDKKTEVIDVFLRDEYWYYLRGAKLIQNRSIITNQKFYVLLTYLHEDMGAFLVVANSNSQNQIFINTFVKLGDQFQEKKQQQEFPFVFLEPVVLTLN